VTVVFLLAATGCWADVELPRALSEGMALQRDSKVMIWCTADPGTKVRIQFRGDQFVTGVDTLGQWTVSLGPYPAGGPYEMVAPGRNSFVLHNILIGDVWRASGQSNMSFPVEHVANTGETIERDDLPKVRLFNVEDETATHPKRCSFGRLACCHSENCR